MQKVNNIPTMVSLPKKPLTNLQIELLKFLSLELTDTEAEKVSKLLIEILRERLDNEIDKTWVERGYTQATMEQWLREHLRTPYTENV